VFVFPSEGDQSRPYVGVRELRRGRRLSLPLIAAILGHRNVKTTQQYAHLADSPVKAGREPNGRRDRRAAAIEGRSYYSNLVRLRGRSG
jgi:hypothetical protein